MICAIHGRQMMSSQYLQWKGAIFSGMYWHSVLQSTVFDALDLKFWRALINKKGWTSNNSDSKAFTKLYTSDPRLPPTVSLFVSNGVRSIYKIIVNQSSSNRTCTLSYETDTIRSCKALFEVLIILPAHRVVFMWHAEPDLFSMRIHLAWISFIVLYPEHNSHLHLLYVDQVATPEERRIGIADDSRDYAFRSSKSSGRWKAIIPQFIHPL